MRKKTLLWVFLLLAGGHVAAQSNLIFYNEDHALFQTKVNAVDSISLRNQANTVYLQGDTLFFYPTKGIDSILFVHETPVDTVESDTGTVIAITYAGDTAYVINPWRDSGVSVRCSGAFVTVTATSGIKDLTYSLSGSSENGAFQITSDKRFNLELNGVSLRNATQAAIQVVKDVKVSVILRDSTISYLSDSSASSAKAVFLSKGQLVFSGKGTLQVNGKCKHGIFSNDYIRLLDGTISVNEAVSDALHADYIQVYQGNLDLHGKTGMEAEDSIVEISGGNVRITVDKENGKAVKCVDTIHISGGTVTILLTGNASKGLKSDHMVLLSGGTTQITASGSTVLDTVGSGYDPSYCTGIKSDGNVSITGSARLNVTCGSGNVGGKCISTDGSVIINSGTVTLVTAGAGATYTDSAGTTDSYTSACIKSDAHVYLYGGTVSCSSSGSGGKGINCDSNIVIGTLNARDSNLMLTVTTTGERFLVSSGSGGSGGGWGGGHPGQNSGDYANPKGIKALQQLVVNSGFVQVTCTQSNEGGECMESKNELAIHGGVVEAVSQNDDAINAANKIQITGGKIYAVSSGNDGIDCNGGMYISGGLTIAVGARQPEAGLDCDQNTFEITGGIAIGIGGDNSSPTSGSTQKCVSYSATSGSTLCVLDANSNALITMQLPTISGSGGGGFPGGGGSSIAVLMTHTGFATGSYTLKYGGSISGGSAFHGYYTGATYTGGTSKSFSIGNSVVTKVR